MKWFDPAKMMAVFAALAVASAACVMYLPSTVLFTAGSLPFSANVLALCAMSGFMSLMFPTIYGIGLGGIDPRAHKLGAAGLIMAIVGGALLTPWMASIIDSPGFWAHLVPMFDATVDQNLRASSMSLRASFVVPAICFAVVLAYALAFMRRGEKKD
jgi:FHS family L-fucose permease-like MFS transporter